MVFHISPVVMRLTRGVDSVQGNPSGPDKASNPLQLTLPNKVLENDVIGEMHGSDGLLRRRALVLLLGITPKGYGLSRGELVVLHSLVKILLREERKKIQAQEKGLRSMSIRSKVTLPQRLSVELLR